MDNNSVYIFISPHLDDAIFSCGGYMHQLASSGKRIILVTLATADDDSGLPLSPFAQHLLKYAGGVKNNSFFRRREDRAAADNLGVEILHLGFKDALYRRDTNQNSLYTEGILGIPVHPYDWGIFVPEVESKLNSLLDQYSAQVVNVFCPSAWGGHVDHAITRFVVDKLPINRQRLYYYDDFPYALHNFCLGEDSLTLLTIKLNLEDIEARCQASAHYSSQLPGQFPARFDIPQIIRHRFPLLARLLPKYLMMKGTLRRMEMSITEYIQQVGGERYWQRCIS